jgi:hypothetical protein
MQVYFNKCFKRTANVICPTIEVIPSQVINYQIFDWRLQDSNTRSRACIHFRRTWSRHSFFRVLVSNLILVFCVVCLVFFWVFFCRRVSFLFPGLSLSIYLPPSWPALRLSFPYSFLFFLIFFGDNEYTLMQFKYLIEVPKQNIYFISP